MRMLQQTLPHSSTCATVSGPSLQTSSEPRSLCASKSVPLLTWHCSQETILLSAGPCHQLLEDSLVCPSGVPHVADVCVCVSVGRCMHMAICPSMSACACARERERQRERERACAQVLAHVRLHVCESVWSGACTWECTCACAQGYAPGHVCVYEREHGSEACTLASVCACVHA